MRALHFVLTHPEHTGVCHEEDCNGINVWGYFKMVSNHSYCSIQYTFLHENITGNNIGDQNQLKLIFIITSLFQLTVIAMSNAIYQPLLRVVVSTGASQCA